jgi:tetratricopeptide (TPR) repeat protein
MKKVVFLFLALMPFFANAQKAIKPNLNKALGSWRDGKFAEAKQNIDLCQTDPKLSLDAKTWYFSGLIYASIDTTKDETLHALDADAFEKSLGFFAKAEELNKNAKGELFYTDAMGLPVLKSQTMAIWANHYLNSGANAYQEDNYEGAMANFEKTQRVLPTDTTAYFYAGFVAQAMENYDKALSNLQKYIDLGGASTDAYSLIINIYSGPKKDKQKALEIAKAAQTKFPDNADFPKVEIGLLIDLGQIEEAKTGLEAAVKKEPDNKTLQFYLGYVYSKLNSFEPAKACFETALRLDPTYFDAQFYLAQLYLIEAEQIRKEMSNLGISEAEKKKRMELDKKLDDSYKVALPYREKDEKINQSDVEVLDKLSTIYYYLGEDAKAERVNKRLKELGVEN